MTANIQALATMPHREMNWTEEKYSRFLEDRRMAGEIRWWAYEAVKLRLADKTWYTADFLVVANDLKLELHEVKTYWKSAGRVGWTEDSRIKIKIAAEMFPIKFIAAALMPDQSWQFEEF